MLSCGEQAPNTETDSTSEEVAAVKKSPVEEGGEFYKSYCTMCHGEKGDGQGSMVEKLDSPVADLTTIAERRDGEFPDQFIYAVIAGSEQVPGHNSGDMPNWLETFKKSENITDEKILEEKIYNIVAYLKTIQQ